MVLVSFPLKSSLISKNLELKIYLQVIELTKGELWYIYVTFHVLFLPSNLPFTYTPV